MSGSSMSIKTRAGRQRDKSASAAPPEPATTGSWPMPVTMVASRSAVLSSSSMIKIFFTASFM